MRRTPAGNEKDPDWLQEGPAGDGKDLLATRRTYWRPEGPTGDEKYFGWGREGLTDNEKYLG